MSDERLEIKHERKTLDAEVFRTLLTDLLATANEVVVGTYRTDGTAVVLPSWFVVWKGDVYISTPSKSRKVARIARLPRGTLLIHDGARWKELRGIHCEVGIQQVHDSTAVGQLQKAYEEKYARLQTRRADLPSRTSAYYDRGMNWYRLEPFGNRFTHWNNRRQ